jgi:GR25 family glycosyltransferase involved in LPS biosynthesis
VKYIILSIDDSRAEKKAAIRNVLSGLEEVKIEACNGRVSESVERYQSWYNIARAEWVPKQGELGVWLSNVHAWSVISQNSEPIVMFEDDAILRDNFVEQLEEYISELPDDWDMFCAFVPENQYGDFHWAYSFDENGISDGNPLGYYDGGEDSLLIDSDKVCRAYQGYSCVALVYTPAGAAKLLERAQIRGMTTPVDCFIFEQYRAGHINAYAFKPGQPRLVDIDWNAPSLIQQTEKVL